MVASRASKDRIGDQAASWKPGLERVVERRLLLDGDPGGQDGGAGSYPDLPKVSRCTRSIWFRSLLNSTTAMRPESKPSTRQSVFAPGMRNAAMDRTIPNASIEQTDCILPVASGRYSLAVRGCNLVHLRRREVSMHRAGAGRPLLERQRVKMEAASFLLTNPPPQPAPPDPGIRSRAAPPSALSTSRPPLDPLSAELVPFVDI
jgi:hypothetical protein